MKRNSEGFALITVLCVVLIISGVALALAASMRVEARQVFGDRAALEAEQLCLAGQEMAAYLVSRGLGTTLENLDGLPVQTVRPGQYVIHFPTGDVDLYLDAEDGKLNLSTAPPELLQNFFTVWSEDPARGRMLAAVVKDWRDTDDAPENEGAEAGSYADQGYEPRNRALGIGDLGLLKGLSPADFRDRLSGQQGSFSRRPGLQQFLTDAAVGATVNPEFAPELILRSVPGVTAPNVERILGERRVSTFKDGADFSMRTGVPLDSPAMNFFHYARRVPAIVTEARSADGRLTRSDRRVLENVTGLYLLQGRTR
jgi:type II secretory pathway pseudopilin PulG